MLWGTNYWTFLTKHPGGDLGYKDIMRTNALSDAQISAFKTRVNQKVAALKKIKSDAELIYIIVPSPATIYTENLPSYIKPTNGVRRIDQIMDALAETDAKFINVLDLFEEHKNDEQFKPTIDEQKALEEQKEREKRIEKAKKELAKRNKK